MLPETLAKLSESLMMAAKKLAADDRLWNTQEVVERTLIAAMWEAEKHGYQRGVRDASGSGARCLGEESTDAV